MGMPQDVVPKDRSTDVAPTAERVAGERDRMGVARRYRPVALGQLATDATCILAALFTAYRGASGFPGSGLVLALIVGPVAWITVFHGFGLYRSLHLSAAEEFKRIVSATTVGVGVLTLAEAYWMRSPSRMAPVVAWGTALVLELSTRRVWRWRIRALRRSGRLALRTLIVGTNEEARRIARAMERPVRGFIHLGYIATAASSDCPDDAPVFGLLEDLDGQVGSLGAECLFVAASAVSPRDMLRLSRLCRRENLELRVSANLPDILASRLTIQSVDDEVLALTLRPARLTGTQAVLKRSFDLLLAIPAAVVCLPLMFVIALAVKLTSPGPVLFRQERITKGGRVFTIYKFRTMVRDPERAMEGKLLDLSKPFFKLRDDPRLTRVGRLLRASSLDELPQLWNVIRGDMSLVGPRPLPADQVVSNAELLAPRHEVAAGLTGWWQINGRSDVDHEAAVRMDLFYIENWSLSLDLYILLKTVGVLLARRGAY